MKKVVIMLSTYNGEKYLREQLDSLVNQTYKNIEILIRDDGSKDNTVSIIEEYMKKYENISLIRGENKGFIGSFLELLRRADGDYYSYADQDDVWFLDKIEKAVNLLEKETDDIPLLYVSNYDYYDSNMNFISHANTVNRVPSFTKSMVENIAPGMTMVLNQKAHDEMLKMNPEKSLLHDWWTYLVCVSIGKVIYDPTVTVKYRRHLGNVTTVEQGFFNKLKWWIKTFLTSNEFWKDLKKQQKAFFEMYADKLSEKDYKLLKLFCKNKSIVTQTKKVFYPIRFKDIWWHELMIRGMFFLWKN